MGMRKYKRQIARDRMTSTGVGNVNRKMGYRNAEFVPNWKTALYGETGEKARKAQMHFGALNARKRRIAKKGAA